MSEKKPSKKSSVKQVPLAAPGATKQVPLAAAEAVKQVPLAAAEVAEQVPLAEERHLPYEDLPPVLIAAAECTPLAKVGGLADMVGALPKYLARLGVDARVILPFHRVIKDRYRDQVVHLCDFQVGLGWRSQYVGIEKLELDGTIYYLIDNEYYFGDGIYRGGEPEGEQYAFFTRAALEAIPRLDFQPGILHCNDWHTAMMPMLIKTQYYGRPQGDLKTLLTIHNLAYQGKFSHEFDRDFLGIDDRYATPEFVEHYGCDNMLKAGCVFADRINTVSPTYADEIRTEYYGEKLDGILRARGSDLSGILNGIDTDVWNPQTDPCLTHHFSRSNLAGKREVKADLLCELGLRTGVDTPLLAMVTRLTPQKGIDLVDCVIDELMDNNDLGFIILGSGESGYEGFLRGAEERHKGRLCSYIGYNDELAHRIYAGADLFLMPSMFEPCGLAQMIAMRYGALPIVRETGGLKDSVKPYNRYTGEGNGFSFANYDAREMETIITQAIGVFQDEVARTGLVHAAMGADFGFPRCARSYASLYRELEG